MRRGCVVTLLVGLLLAGTMGVRALAAGAVVGFPSDAVRVDVLYHPTLFAPGTPGTITDPAAIATIAAVYNADGPAYPGACTVSEAASTGTFTVTTQEGAVLPGDWSGCRLELQGDPASPRNPVGFGDTISATLALSSTLTVTATPPAPEATATATPTVPSAPSSPTPTASALPTRTAVSAASAVVTVILEPVAPSPTGMALPPTDTPLALLPTATATETAAPVPPTAPRGRVPSATPTTRPQHMQPGRATPIVIRHAASVRSRPAVPWLRPLVLYWRGWWHVWQEQL